MDRIHLNVCLHVNEPELWNWKWVKEIQVSGKKLSICRAKENMNNEGKKTQNVCKTFAKHSLENMNERIDLVIARFILGIKCYIKVINLVFIQQKSALWFPSTPMAIFIQLWIWFIDEPPEFAVRHMISITRNAF